MKGPPPLPTHLKIVSGNRGKRPMNKAEPRPEARIPSPSDELSTEALQEWKRIAPLLLAAAMITVIDRAAHTVSPGRCTVAVRFSPHSDRDGRRPDRSGWRQLRTFHLRNH
jgi:hypothetical protein